MSNVRDWWRLWWDETLIIAGVSTAICLVIWGGWWLFQTMPLPMESGKVVGHDYTAQYEEEHDGGTTCYAYDKNGGCTVRMQNPDIHHTHCIGGCYKIQVDGCSNDRRGTEHCRKEWKNVDLAQYEACVTGQIWERGENRCLPQ